MIVTSEQLAKASPIIRRQAAHEWELDHKVLDAVFAAKETVHLKALLEQDIYADPRYSKLPKYRQLALEAYFRGVIDAVSRVAGVSAPLIAANRPKTAPPKKGKNNKKSKQTIVPPPLYPSQGKTSSIPPWTVELPPPNTLLHSPFPLAVDYHG